VSETDKILTPIVAQSSVEASLTSRFTVPFWAWGVGLELLEPEPPDEHPVDNSVNAADASPSNTPLRLHFIGLLLGRGEVLPIVFWQKMS
jgi:hypothetical protein